VCVGGRRARIESPLPPHLSSQVEEHGPMPEDTVTRMSHCDMRHRRDPRWWADGSHAVDVPTSLEEDATRVPAPT
jgi:hypothetical protein